MPTNAALPGHHRVHHASARGLPQPRSLSVRICLLGGFGLTVGGHMVEVPPGAQRVVAAVALSGQPLLRGVIATTLWPDVEERRALANLRSTLRRLGGASGCVLKVGPAHMELAAGVRVDIVETRVVANALLEPGLWLGRNRADNRAMVAELAMELLPGWYEDWVLLAAEDWRQLRLHALEKLTERLTAERHFTEAITAANAAIRTEPLRETAHRLLIEAHLAEGNRAAAIDAYERLKRALSTEVGLAPSQTFLNLIAMTATIVPASTGGGDALRLLRTVAPQ